TTTAARTRLPRHVDELRASAGAIVQHADLAHLRELTLRTRRLERAALGREALLDRARVDAAHHVLRRRPLGPRRGGGGRRRRGRRGGGRGGRGPGRSGRAGARRRGGGGGGGGRLLGLRLRRGVGGRGGGGLRGLGLRRGLDGGGRLGGRRGRGALLDD